MTITALNPWQVLDQLQQNSLRRNATTHRWQPAVDIIETAQHYEIQLDLPGVKADQVTVELEDNTLKISGEKVRTQSRDKTIASRSALLLCTTPASSACRKTPI
ncbi:MAG: Hsp20/alpha crystallin family protein [Gammaproteobacteria bacterium]